MPPTVGGWAAGISCEKVQEDHSPSGLEVQHPERSGGHPKELQSRPHKGELPGLMRINSAFLERFLFVCFSALPQSLLSTLQIFDFSLTDAEMKAIEELNKNIRFVELLMWVHTGWVMFCCSVKKLTHIFLLVDSTGGLITPSIRFMTTTRPQQMQTSHFISTNTRWLVHFLCVFFLQCFVPYKIILIALPLQIFFKIFLIYIIIHCKCDCVHEEGNLFISIKIFSFKPGIVIICGETTYILFFFLKYFSNWYLKLLIYLKTNGQQCSQWHI